MSVDEINNRFQMIYVKVSFVTCYTKIKKILLFEIFLTYFFILFIIILADFPGLDRKIIIRRSFMKKTIFLFVAPAALASVSDSQSASFKVDGTSPILTILRLPAHELRLSNREK